MGARKGAFQKRHQAKKERAAFQLPGVGEGLVDPDFDLLRETEIDDIASGVGAHRGRTEDYE
jgi:hypothetical protein